MNHISLSLGVTQSQDAFQPTLDLISCTGWLAFTDHCFNFLLGISTILLKQQCWKQEMPFTINPPVPVRFVFSIRMIYTWAICVHCVCISWESQTMVAISTESVVLSNICPPTTMSLSWGRTATRHCDRGVVMWLMTSQELVVMLYMWMAAFSLSSESLPPTASSCPCSEAHVEW